MGNTRSSPYATVPFIHIYINVHTLCENVCTYGTGTVYLKAVQLEDEMVVNVQLTMQEVLDSGLAGVAFHMLVLYFPQANKKIKNNRMLC